MPEVFAEADIVCLPSYREGLPKVLLEAAACGCARVATDVPGCREAVIDGHDGLLVPPRDALALAAAIRRLLEDTSLHWSKLPLPILAGRVHRPPARARHSILPIDFRARIARLLVRTNQAYDDCHRWTSGNIR